jgi:hypothetical protein
MELLINVTKRTTELYWQHPWQIIEKINTATIYM